MPFPALAALFVGQPATVSTPTTFFTSGEMAALQEEAKRECGYATPQDLMGLPNSEREKILPCFIRATVKRSEPLLPKMIEAGATVVSVRDFQGLPVFVVQFASGHPRAKVPKGQSSDYDGLLSTRTCNDKWLGGLIDAGMVDGMQGGAVIVYELQTEKAENLAAIAVAQCLDPK